MNHFKVKMILNERLILENLVFQAEDTKGAYELAEEYASKLEGFKGGAKITGITVSKMSKWEVAKWA